MTLHTDKQTVIEIAIQFLRQHFSVQDIDAALIDKVWVVTARIVVFNNVMMEKIRIDINTRKIENYTLITGAN